MSERCGVRALPILAVGGWEIGGCMVQVCRRPNRLQRWIARVLLGWEWVDA